MSDASNSTTKALEKQDAENLLEIKKAEAIMAVSKTLDNLSDVKQADEFLSVIRLIAAW